MSFILCKLNQYSTEAQVPDGFTKYYKVEALDWTLMKEKSTLFCYVVLYLWYLFKLTALRYLNRYTTNRNGNTSLNNEIFSEWFQEYCWWWCCINSSLKVSALYQTEKLLSYFLSFMYSHILYERVADSVLICHFKGIFYWLCGDSIYWLCSFVLCSYEELSGSFLDVFFVGTRFIDCLATVGYWIQRQFLA